MNYILAAVTASALLSCSNTASNKQAETVEPAVLSNVRNKASCVFLTGDEKNNPVISWAETDSAGRKYFFFALFDPAGKKFQSPVSIPVMQTLSLHEEGMPKIAVKGDGTIAALYETNVPKEGSRFGLSNLYYTLSYDKGKTWTEAKPIAAGTAQTGSRSFANIIRLDDGELGAAWLDNNPDPLSTGRPVKFARTNAKEGFGKAVLIESSACECCRTALCSDGGKISVVFRDLLPGSVRDISISTSTDNGRTFQPAVPFSGDNWAIEGCPHNGPSAVGKGDKTYISWFTGSEKTGVYYAELDKNNRIAAKTLLDPNGRFVQLCLMPDGTRVAAFNKTYTDEGRMYSRIMVNRITDKGIFEKEVTMPKVQASYPVVHASGSKDIVTAWSSEGRIYYRTTAIKTINIPVENYQNISALNKQGIALEVSSCNGMRNTAH